MRTAALTLCVLLAACGSRSPVAKGAENTAALPTINKPAPSPHGEPPKTSAGTTAHQPVKGAFAFPAALQGRWGLTPMDCTSTRGDAKGLLIVTTDRMQFYESRALPGADVQVTGDAVAGTFDFTGEGQSWSKYQSLQVRNHKLIRTESNPTASFSYAKCE